MGKERQVGGWPGIREVGGGSGGRVERREEEKGGETGAGVGWGGGLEGGGGESNNNPNVKLTTTFVQKQNQVNKTYFYKGTPNKTDFQFCPAP